MDSSEKSPGYRILVIDDDPAYHHLFKSLLKNEFEVITCSSAQEAIDSLAEMPVNLIIADIHMPGMTGLELLESLKIDKSKKDIPVLIITSLPNTEVEQVANDLGAADFIKKSELVSNKEQVLNQVRMKLVSSINVEGLDKDLESRKKSIVSSVMNSAINGDSELLIEKLCEELIQNMNMDYAGFWKLGKEPQQVEPRHFGKLQPEAAETEQAGESTRLTQLKQAKQSDFSNNAGKDKEALMPKFTADNQLIFEGVIPLFSISERELLKHSKQMPSDSELFALLVLKRKKVSSTKEFQLVERIVQQLGSIIWRLYNKGHQAAS